MNKGQAALTLIFFALVAMLVTSAAVMAIVGHNLTLSKMEQANSAYYTAETGIENALLRLLRQPDYQGETLIIDSQNRAIVTVESQPDLNRYAIISQGQSYQTSHQIKAIIDYNDNVLQIISIEELD